MIPTAAYIHVPFCAHHCGYCDFAVTAGKDHLIELYLEALALELATLARPTAVRTVFIGGGTPTYLDCRQLERLLAEIDRWLPRDRALGETEFSIEATPESLTADKTRLLARHGVTRVSIGAQTFQPELLQVLERVHDPVAVSRAVDAVKSCIPQVSVDLIFGVPGQTLKAWDADLQAALALQPDHFATYGLTYEQGTPLWKQRQRGRLKPLSEEAELALYNRAIDTLEAAGFEHYEISNFARPGRRCRHNQVYWANEGYFGFGVGAARYVDGCRQLNVRDTALYVRRLLAGETPTFQSETLPPQERAKETLVLQLRRSDGIDRQAFQDQTGFALERLAGQAIARLVEHGLIEDDGKCVRLTRRGTCVADAIVCELL